MNSLADRFIPGAPEALGLSRWLGGPTRHGFPTQPGLIALLMPDVASRVMLEVVAWLAWTGSVRVVDGGNCFNAYRVARALQRLLFFARQSARRQMLGLEGLTLDALLERIQVSRAFTCYQMATLLDALPAGPQPVLALGFLDTFYDENAPLIERQRLLQGCMRQLQRLSQQAVVVVSLRPLRLPQVDAAGLLEIVQSAADQSLFQEEVQPELQPRLL
jgi:hypothetical protein